MRYIDIIATANHNLKRNKLRTILTIVAVFIGSFTITLTVGLNAGVNDYISKQLGTLGGDNVLIVTAKGMNSAPTSEPKEYNPNQSTNSTFGLTINTMNDVDVAKIKSVDKVTKVTPQLIPTVSYIQGSSDKKYQLASVNQMVDGIKVDVVAGSAPDNNSTDNQIDILPSYVSVLGFKDNTDAVGKTLTIAAKTPLGLIQTVEAKIVGVQNDSLLASGGFMINDHLTRQLYDITTEGMPDSIRNNYYAVVATISSGMTEKEITDVKNMVKDLGYNAMTVRDRIGTVSTIINAISYALIGFGAVALLAASFGVINTLFMAVQERTKEIGLMKAVGMSGGRVFILFSIEAILLGFWGSLIGMSLAYVVGSGLSNYASQTFLKDLKGFTLIEFPITYLLIVMGVVMLIAYLAGTLPARRAAKLNPIDALRYE
ncbi:ABC transporter permease [Candidatus Saccharibacteria bacterium]|nr:ABC transporter permease [Candidatus Saccharibacteria bacterium]